MSTSMHDSRPAPLPDLTRERGTLPGIPPSLRAIILGLLLLGLTPVLMYLLWVLGPSSPLALLIVDKTSTDKEGVERASFFWTLKHAKFRKPAGDSYSVEVDYRGFMPLSDTAHLITGLEGMNAESVDSLAGYFDAVFFLDTYGVPAADRGVTEDISGDFESILYGGFSTEDLHFLREARNRNLPIVAEFNLIGSPTGEPIRQQVQELLDLTWTGWTGRYFATLDTADDREFPKWVLQRHRRQYGIEWGYRLPGVVMVHVDGTLIVLEAETYLRDPLPRIVTEQATAAYYGVRPEIPYPFWFDVMAPGASNEVVSHFVLSPNQYGDSLLASKGLPSRFPAVIRGRDDEVFYYLCMDATDNPVPYSFLASFRGIHLFDWLFFDPGDPMDRRAFFWRYYLPMMERILDEVSAAASGRP